MPLFPKFMEFGFGGGGSGGRSKRGMIDGKRGNKGGASLVAMEREVRKEGSSGRQRLPWLSFFIQYVYILF